MAEYHDFVTANINHFDKASDTYDSYPALQDLTKKQAAFILSDGWSFSAESTTVLSFACGAGLIEKDLVAHCKYIQGVDISPGMVDKYNKTAETLGVSSKMSAIACELKGVSEEVEGRKFDVVLCTMAYHHFESPEEITRILTYFLKPGGALLVTGRFIPDAASQVEDIPEQYKSIVPHKAGFSEEDMRKLFEGAGLGAFSLNVVPGATMHGFFPGATHPKLFLAKGIKPI
ncbi:S-adenosyl-L-methionine-dependent methyltransferase [Armillaria gallica]|uniref:S-adenosyl-L-methionine-dependent methyltransferase n=1 Tax=Armillaria gallica TaxID=47427 RepID=A0A2H3DH47_ARMGA|nr:S-adenosyl-L-methionine-dependent methyltransferase [Armillaria gallica]